MTKIVSLYLPDKLVKIIDERKANYSRSSFIANCLIKQLNLKESN